MRESWFSTRSGGFVCVAVLAALAAVSVRAVAQDEAFAPAAAIAEIQEEDATPVASHVQTAIIKVTDDANRSVAMHTFCMNQEGQLLVGVGAGPGQIRVYDADGNHLTTWDTTIKPEAINVDFDGNVLLAGNGTLQKLDNQGNVLLEKPAPNARQLKESEDKLRDQVIQQYQQQAANLTRYPEMFRQQIARFQDMLKQIDDKDPDEITEQEQQRRTILRQQIERYEQSLKQYETMAAQQTRELTEEEIQQRVQTQLAMKMRISSISATENDVYLACPATEGYGFEVWRLDAQFGNPEKIITDLRGCCGQMDVQADANGVFVAENARFRVCRYDRDGKMEVQWGSRARDGVEGFGSCCNPMNVAFGPGGEIYTAESTLGRIKRYSPDGELRGLIGSVEIVPGCKKVTIAVNPDGSRVYMMDMTRSHIVVMTEKPSPVVDDTAAN